jgi:hypothetical protein
MGDCAPSERDGIVAAVDGEEVLEFVVRNERGGGAVEVETEAFEDLLLRST